MKRVTFDIDDALLAQAERLAAERGVSIGSMLHDLLARETGAAKDAGSDARRRMGEMARQTDIPRRMIPWTREELYDRDVSGYERGDLRGDRHE